MTTKKLVSQQQLYGGVGGSKKCLKQSAPARGPPTSTADYPQHSLNRCLLQSRELSRSNNYLPSLDLYGSYGTLPQVPPARAATVCSHGVQAVGPCRRHFTGSGRWYPPVSRDEDLCYHSQPEQAPKFPVCTCADRTCQQQQQQQPQQPPLPPQQPQRKPTYPRTPTVATHHHHHQPAAHNEHKPLENGYYFGYDHGVTHVTDEEDSAFPGIHDFHLLRRNIPALRRTGVDTNAIRQYFYPDGGWGWIICGVAFLVHVLTTGLQLSYGLLLFYAIHHVNNPTGIEWLGALSWSISMLVTPFVVAFCRKKSTRLMGIVGGLVLPLGVLFTSFATELSQIVFSYGFVFGIGVSMVRESSTIMLGNYFKRRRQFVEMIAMSGEGVGIALFSVILKEGVGKAGWRFGLQIIAALVAISFFMGFLYRPASLYHPQRRAIQHLKNQRKKMRENKFAANQTEQNTPKYFFLDISALKLVTVRIFVLISAVAAFGIYTPMFTMSLNAAKEGSDVQDLVLLQAFLGMSTALGVIIAGALVRNPIKVRSFVVTKLVVSQIFLSTVAVSILFLSFVMGFRGLCVLSWIYGIGFGGFRYSFKMLALERVKLKQFSKAWGLIRGIECIPVLGSVPLTIFLNDYSLKYGRAGFYICSAATAIAGIIIFFISYSNVEGNSAGAAASRKHGNGAVRTVRSMSTHHIRPNYAAEYLYNGCEYPVANLLNRSCISLNQVEDEHAYRTHMYGCQRLRAPYLPTHLHYEPENALKDFQYNFGQGSVGARSGRRLQKSLSFIQQNPYVSASSQHLVCGCHSEYHWSQRDIRAHVLPDQMLCTCSPTMAHFQNSRSRSVPEGLSTISQQCTCKSAPSKEIVYLPRTPLHGRELACAHHSLDPNEVLVQRIPRTPKPATRCYQQQQKRTHGMSKPIHFIEQITTSV